MKGRRWEDWATYWLRGVYKEERFTLQMMVGVLNRTPNAIRLKASRLGLKRPVLEVPTCPICGQQIPQETRP